MLMWFYEAVVVVVAAAAAAAAMVLVLVLVNLIMLSVTQECVPPSFWMVVNE
jgi:hypothetical protein